MTVEEILSNEELRRHEFPVATDKVFLAHAGVCPLPRRVTEAMKHYVDSASLDDQETVVAEGLFREARALAARLIGAQPDEIALVGPTSVGLSLVANGFPLRKGDNVVIYQDDYPSNVYAWMPLAERGVQVRLLNIRNYGRIRRIDVEGQIDEQTRLVALASCHFVSGYRIEIPAIGKLLKDKDIAFCVDGIQTVGAFPTPAEHIDFLAADSHKWLLGPCSAGIMFVRKSWQDQVRPTIYGWHNVRCPNYVAQEAMVHPPDGRRYEAGTANLVGLAGLHAAMQMVLELGIENIARELLRKRAWLVPALQQKNYEVLYADAPPGAASGIVTFHRPGADLAALHEKLTAAKIITSLRADRKGNRYIRLSPHFYNTDAELHQLLELL
jgi:cysteine desulfurase / selenocysteine lyase